MTFEEKVVFAYICMYKYMIQEISLDKAIWLYPQEIYDKVKYLLFIQCINYMNNINPDNVQTLVTSTVCNYKNIVTYF